MRTGAPKPRRAHGAERVGTTILHRARWECRLGAETWGGTTTPPHGCFVLCAPSHVTAVTGDTIMLDTCGRTCIIEYNQLKGGRSMANSKRLQVTVSESTLERLLAICEDKGLSRSAVLSLALDKLWKEEYADRK